jgi:hypothetical protein
MRARGNSIVWAVVAVVAVLALLFVARIVLYTPEANLEIEVDAVTKKAAIKVAGGKSVDLPNVLDLMMQKDHEVTKATICTWGSTYGIMDAFDADQRRLFKLVHIDDFWGLYAALKNNHCKGKNLPFFKQLSQYADAAVPPEKKRVLMTWHTSKEIPGNAILFPKGDTWFAERLNRECSIVLNEDVPFLAVVHSPAVIGAGRIQVSEGTFVRILSASDGKLVIPVVDSPEWKAIVGKGKVEVDLLC